MEQVDDRAVEQVALGLGIGLTWLGHVLDASRELRHEASELPAVALDVRLERGLGSRLHVVAERFDPRLVWDSEVLLRAAEEDGRSGPMRFDREVRGETRLADPRLARQQGQAHLSPLSLVPETLQLLPFGYPSDVADRWHLTQAGRQRNGVCLSPRGLPFDLHRLDRSGQPLELERPQGGERVLPAATHHHPHKLAGEYLASARGVAEARRLDHGGPEVVAVLAVGIAEADPDAHAQLILGPSVPLLDSLLHAHGAIHAARGTREHDHQTVAHVLDLAPARGLDRLAKQGEMLAAQLLGGRGPDPRCEPGRTDQVGEKHADCLDRAHLPILSRWRGPRQPCEREPSRY